MTKITCENGHHIYNWKGELKIGDKLVAENLEAVGDQPQAINGQPPHACHICRGHWIAGRGIGAIAIHTEKGWFPECATA